MKQQLKTWIATATFVLLAFGASAQTATNLPAGRQAGDTAPWASDKGYWVIETNVKTPLEHTIRFYTNEYILVYTEKVAGIRMNPERKKIKMKLKEVLEASVIAWERNKKPEADKNYVTARLK
jgi:hypothetical protein